MINIFNIKFKLFAVKFIVTTGRNSITNIPQTEIIDFATNSNLKQKYYVLSDQGGYRQGSIGVLLENKPIICGGQNSIPTPQGTIHILRHHLGYAPSC